VGSRDEVCQGGYWNRDQDSYMLTPAFKRALKLHKDWIKVQEEIEVSLTCRSCKLIQSSLRLMQRWLHIWFRLAFWRVKLESVLPVAVFFFVKEYLVPMLSIIAP
jgi:hypothetical protein